MDKPSHWVTFLNYIFNPMAVFVHILKQQKTFAFYKKKKKCRWYQVLLPLWGHLVP